MKKGNYLLIISFLAIIFTIPILGIIMPNKKVSMAENRELQGFPDLNQAGLGDLTEKLDNYFLDQFPYRDLLINIYTKMQLVIKGTEIRNAIILDDWLFIRDYHIDKDSLEELAKAMEKITVADKDMGFHYIIFPSKNAMLSDLYPDYIEGGISQDNNRVISERLGKISNLNTFNVLNKMLEEKSLDERSNYYYKTDYHWNGKGSFEAFRLMVEHLEGEAVVEKAESKIESLALEGKYFKGDLEKRFSGNIKNQDIPIINKIIDSESIDYYTSLDDSRQVDRQGLMAANINKRSVDYNDINIENLSCIRILNKNSITNKKALVFKDSYFNALVDPMTSVFEELIIIDPRYYEEDYSYEEILASKDLDYILFCYHQSNIDKSLTFLLEAE